MKIRYLTVSDSNYFSHVVALFHSLRVHGQVELYWGCIDNGSVDLRCITADGVALIQPNVASVLESDSIVETSTRYRPLLLQAMFDACACEIGCYIDPDIFVYSPLEDLINSSASVWITPHLLADDLLHARNTAMRERAISQAVSLQRWGAFNMGIYFVRNDASGLRFLRCYQNFLDRTCALESLYSFVDQKWMDVLVSMFPSQIEVMSHPGINLSYWNLPFRKLTREGEAYLVNGAELKAIHFSGVGVAHINCDYGQGSEIRALIAEYQQQLSNCKEQYPCPVASPSVQSKAPRSWRRFVRKIMFYFLLKTESI